jgi:hypothetical protein
MGVLALGVAALWHDGRAGAERAPSAAPKRSAAPVAVANDERVPPLTMAAAHEGLPLVPHDPRERVPPGPLHPHPITSAHARIFRENHLLAALNAAMDANDVAGMRRLLEGYREEYPEDANELQEGYALIADCFDHADPSTAERAQRYYASETASTLRRYVRRHCLER